MKSHNDSSEYYATLAIPVLKSLDTVVVIQKKNYGDAALLIPVIENLLDLKSTLRVIICVPKNYHVFLELSENVVCLDTGSLFSVFSRLLRNRLMGQKVGLLDFQPSLRFRIIGKLLAVNILTGLVSTKNFLTKFDTVSPRLMVDNRFRSESNLDVLRRLGCNADWNARRFRYLASKLKNPCNFSDNYIVVHPGSRWMFKSLGRAQWVRLLEQLSARYECKLVLTGSDSPVETELGAFLEQNSDAISMVGKSSIPSLIALLRDASGFIGVDTFTSHLAGFLDLPGLVLFGPSNPSVWGPHPSSRLRVITANACNFPCIPCGQDGCGGSKMSQCLNSISPDFIVESFARTYKQKVTL